MKSSKLADFSTYQWSPDNSRMIPSKYSEKMTASLKVLSCETSFKSKVKIKKCIDLWESTTSITLLKDNLKKALQVEGK